MLLVLGLLAPAAASGDVLVNAIHPSTVACGKSVKLGVWYQSSSGGPKWAHITIETKTGKTVWHKNVVATTTWQYWHYKGKCGTSYVAIYTTARGSAKFPFRVRRGGSHGRY